MEIAKRPAYAKINLTLEILDRREDGYHNIRSVMQKTTLCDTVLFEDLPDGEIRLECDKAVCDMRDNLAYRAAKKYLERFKQNTGKSFGIAVTIQKRIPDRAGLAGGSADAACVLDYLYDTRRGMSYEEVEELAAELGSDINFCLNRRRCALCTDRGIRCESIPPLDGVHIVLCVPDEGLKTPQIYGEFDRNPIRFADNPSEQVKAALSERQNEKVFSLVRNAFTPICTALCPTVGTLLARMRAQNPDACEMSGSGSAVFGLFADGKAAQKAFDTLRTEYAQTFLIKTLAD